jgi:hypothetical protein
LVLSYQIFAGEGQHNTLVIVRALVSPLTYAVLPLGIVCWRTIGWTGRICVGVAVACSICFSIMRGTDKEIADLFTIGVSAAFVSYGRTVALGARGFALVRRYWKHALIAVVFVTFAQSMFATRKEERLGGYVSRTTVCASDSHVCANLDNPWIGWLPLRQRFGVSLFILSTCSGYYRLDLALQKPFESTYGVGHSPAAMSAYEAVKPGDDGDIVPRRLDRADEPGPFDDPQLGIFWVQYWHCWCWRCRCSSSPCSSGFARPTRSSRAPSHSALRRRSARGWNGPMSRSRG